MTISRLNPSLDDAIKVVAKQKDITTSNGSLGFTDVYDAIDGYTCVGIIGWQANTTYLFASTLMLSKIEVRCTSGNYTGRVYWRLLYVRDDLL